jgi:hypothetical protein
MSSAFIVIVLVATQQVPEMAFAENDHMVETLTSDRPDEPLCISILPGRTGRSRPIPNAHGTNALDEASTIDAVPVSDHIPR